MAAETLGGVYEGCMSVFGSDYVFMTYTLCMYIFVDTYIYIYIYIYVFTYVCMYVCMYGWSRAWISLCYSGATHRSTTRQDGLRFRVWGFGGRSRGFTVWVPE